MQSLPSGEVKNPLQQSQPPPLPLPLPYLYSEQKISRVLESLFTPPTLAVNKDNTWSQRFHKEWNELKNLTIELQSKPNQNTQAILRTHALVIKELIKDLEAEPFLDEGKEKLRAELLSLAETIEEIPAWAAKRALYLKRDEALSKSLSSLTPVAPSLAVPQWQACPSRIKKVIEAGFPKNPDSAQRLPFVLEMGELLLTDLCDSLHLDEKIADYYDSIYAEFRILKENPDSKQLNVLKDHLKQGAFPQLKETLRQLTALEKAIEIEKDAPSELQKLQQKIRDQVSRIKERIAATEKDCIWLEQQIENTLKQVGIPPRDRRPLTIREEERQEAVKARPPIKRSFIYKLFHPDEWSETTKTCVGVGLRRSSLY